MRILVVGSGGREHALAWSLSRSPRTTALFIAPGNAGTASVGTNVPIRDDRVEELLQFALDRSIDLTIVGPEKPLVLGLVDRFRENGLAVVGPTAAAAQLEGSKSFAKAFMERHGIPTAGYRTFGGDQYAEARAYVESEGAPIVVKASGLAGGKGAIVCLSLQDAVEALDFLIRDRALGSAAEEVVVESFMKGEEASVFALCDGANYILLASAQDHKRIGEGDTGPNTGGMGAYAPAPVVTESVLKSVREQIIEPTLRGMAEEGHPYTGILYCGLMIASERPKVVEFNCRLGDPEAQVVLPLLDSDPVDVFEAAAGGNLNRIELRQRAGAAACVVLASKGYPGNYESGHEIRGLESTPDEQVLIFQAGTKLDEEGRVVTAGGRVLGVTAVGRDLSQALDRAYAAVDGIGFEGMQYRRDIGKKGLDR